MLKTQYGEGLWFFSSPTVIFQRYPDWQRTPLSRGKLHLDRLEAQRVIRGTRQLSRLVHAFSGFADDGAGEKEQGQKLHLKIWSLDIPATIQR